MFEREIKFIYDFNLNKVNKLGPYFTFEQLQTTDIHPAILQYISAEIDYLVFEDRQKLLKNSVFDYSGEKISYHFNEISEELKKIKRFSLEYIAKLILHSTSFTINYLVRPKWTLTRFIFDESKHKTSNEIKQILNYVYYYKFQKKIITSYINSKKILSMNSEEFEDLLDKSDKLGMETNFKGILSHSFISMAEFFNIGQMQKTRIPLSAVELFLEEKDLPHHLRKLTDTFGNDENSRFNIGDYMKVLTAVMITKKEEEPGKEQLILFDEQKEEEIIVPVEAAEEEIQTDKEEVEKTENEIVPDEVLETEKPLVTIDEQRKEETKEDLVEPEAEEVKPIDDQNEKETEPVNTEEIQNPTETKTEDSTEVISSLDEEVKLVQHKKIRIKVNDNNRIEPVEEEIQQQEEPAPTQTLEPTDEDYDSYTSIFKTGDDKDDEDEIEIITPDLIENKKTDRSVSRKEKDSDQLPDIIPQTNSLENIFEVEENETDAEAEEEEFTEFKNIFEKEKQSREADDFDFRTAKEKSDEPAPEETKLDLAEILEHKKMTKIIEVVFDYDIEDFASMLDEISNCRNIEDAHFIVNGTLTNRHINPNSKEAETLRNIITEYFGS